MTNMKNEDIAIIGMAGRFPGAKNLHEFWDNLKGERNNISIIPEERWNWRDVFGNPQKEENKTNSKWGGFIEDIDKFDPLFFNISPKEANFIDPQHRLFLETVWQVIENAGYNPESLFGKKIGVYAGVSKNDYAEMMGEDISPFISTGTVHSILANRVSYFFNFHGPSEAIDTACSSSLVALHNAVRDIREGECQSAIVGGVNALLSPRMYISHAKSGMLSVDGQCKTFDASANGYVRGEGVAALFLKPLGQAIADRDNVLGVIKATAVNHGGRSNFLTAPNVAAQSDVIYTALKRAEVDPRNISYIEAHGTGTPLGDPIEINALKKAFLKCFEEQNMKPLKNYCGIGSVKTNIGHLESAAGIVSIIKVLLAMKNGVLPGLLNYEKTNPYIMLEDSPFYIVDNTIEWKRRRVNGKTLSRQAGVSGFGMGGVNTHVILEEPPKNYSKRRKIATKDRLILLSAKKNRLKPYVAQLLEYLQSEEGRMLHLDDLAFTLMFGREDFEERLAFIVTNTEQAVEILEKYLNDQLAEECFHGIASTEGEETQITAKAMDDLSTLAQKWVQGKDIKWEESGFAGKRIMLPGYLFNKMRCWFKQENSPSALEQNVNVSHSYTVSHCEQMMQDHLLQKTKVLPGVGYLSLLGKSLNLSKKICQTFKDIYWLKPLTLVEELSKEIKITLRKEQDEQKFQISSSTGIHCQGYLESNQTSISEKQIDIKAILNRCNKRENKTSLYNHFSHNGLDYGTSFQVIDTLHLSNEEAIALIDKNNHARSYEGMLDGALQAAVGLSVQNKTAKHTQFVPYSAESFTFSGDLEKVRYYYIKQYLNNQRKVLKFDLYYCDQEGNVLASVKGFTKRMLLKLEVEGPPEILYYTSLWKKLEIRRGIETVKSLFLINGTSVLEKYIQDNIDANVQFENVSIEHKNTDDYLKVFKSIKESGVACQQILVQSENPGIEDLRNLLLLIQALIKNRFRNPIKILYVSENSQPDVDPALYAVGGLARTLKYEYPSIQLEVVSFDKSIKDYGPALLDELFTSVLSPLHEVQYRGEQRFIREMVEINEKPKSQDILLRKGGVYLIAGGTGGLGQVFSEYLAKEYQATLILLGRRPINGEIQVQINNISNLGGLGEYIPADIGDEQRVREVVQTVREKYGCIHGVIQGSGLIEDSFILNKSIESFEKVLQPKITGTLNLDNATAGDELDFFLMFSSIAALMPNQGQCDYSIGNSFMDYYAEYRKYLASNKKRSGISLAINWPLWADGGMQVQLEEKEHLWEVFGMEPLQTNRGLTLFQEALNFSSSRGLCHVVGIEGDKLKINQHFSIQKNGSVTKEMDIPKLIRRDLYSILAQALKLPLSSIRANKSLQEMGVNSLLLYKITDLIIQYFDIDFKPTLLFEYETPEQILNFLLEDKQMPEIKKHFKAIGGLAPRYRSTGLIDLDKVDLEQGLFKRRYDNKEFYMVDHVVNNKYNVPGACYAEMARQAGSIAQPMKKVTKLRGCYWAKQLSSNGEPFTVNIQLIGKENGADYEIYSLEDMKRTVHATGSLVYEELGVEEELEEQLDLEAIRQRCTTSWTRKQVYNQIHAEGLIVGETFMPMQEIVMNEQEALALLELPETILDTYDDYLLHPTMLTGVFQTALINNRFHGNDSRNFIPIAIESLSMKDVVPSRCYVHCKVNSKTKNNLDIKKFNLVICTEDGRVVARLEDFSIKATNYEKEVVIHSLPKETKVEQDVIRKHTQAFLSGLLSSAIGLEPSAIRPDETFEAYGINSVMILELNKIFEETFGGGLSKTLFFEYGNLSELTDYFLEEHRETLSSKIQLLNTIQKPVQSEEPLQQGTKVEQDVIRKHTQAFLSGLLSSAIGLEPSAIRPDETFEAYGINSVMILELNKIFEETFGGGLSKTLFFEYGNLSELTDYFLEEHRETLSSKIQLLNTTQEPVQPEEPVISQISSEAPPIKDDFTFYSTSLESTGPASRDIAIIGLAGRYPQADTLEEFWKNIKCGKDCIDEIHPERFDYLSYYDADKQNDGLYSKWGSFIKDVDKFDPLFFNISPREAELMDPQERLFLEVVWHTLEDAGYTRQSLTEQNVGVFVGSLWQPYQELGTIMQAQGQVVSPSTLSYSIANRVSYFCNFQGPSMTVDTACSSSLTALHLACQSILNGESNVAIAGGVNLSIGAGKYLFLSQYKFLSTDGKCRSFGANGDGYVPGEGIGAVMLKPLDAAVGDGDHIYGVIKATAANHGGKTNGYTVPNPIAQSELILKTLRQAKVNPRRVTYIEAHGTGTALGDPIEINGLTRAFSKYTKEKQFCAIGSVKSNIGHLEASAGIVGLTKVLLQLKHKQIAPNLHSKKLNPNIEFENTPFFVPQELTEWKRPVLTFEGETKEYSRSAGISSFGAGGSNAHVVVEEYIPPVAEKALALENIKHRAHIVLSAKNSDSLKRQAQQLLEAIGKRRYNDNDLRNIAYTLQVGREMMEERLAFTVGSLQELHGKLQDFLNEKQGIEGLYRGKVKRNKNDMEIFSKDEDMQMVIDAWILKGKYSKLLDLWVRGFNIDWDMLYSDTKPRRISLPGYAFLKERYWFPMIDNQGSSRKNLGLNTFLHSLLHQNTSNLSEVRFSSTFTGREFFIADNIVCGQKSFPSLGDLEVVRAAVEHAEGADTNRVITMRLKDVVWSNSLIVRNQPVKMNIGLFQEKDGEISYKIYDIPDVDQKSPFIYSRGRIEVCIFEEMSTLDLYALEAECSQGIISSAECYELFKDMGLYYGPSFQVIETISVGANQVLAKLSLPPTLLGTHDEYVMHPSLIEAALQVVYAFKIKSGDYKLVKPLALQEVEIIKPCSSTMCALVRFGNRGIDIDLCDEYGTICVRIKGLELQEVERDVKEKSSFIDRKMYLLKKTWEPCSITTAKQLNKTVAILATPETWPLAVQLVKYFDKSRIFDLSELTSNLHKPEQEWKEYAGCIDLTGCGKERKEELDWILWLQQLIQCGNREGLMLLGVSKGLEAYQNETINLSGASRAGLYRMLQSEYSYLRSRHMDVDSSLEDDVIAQKIAAEFLAAEDTIEVCYRNGQRYRSLMKEWEKESKQEQTIEFPEDYVLWITGGTRGLGYLCAQHFVKQYGVKRLVLTGREELPPRETWEAYQLQQTSVAEKIRAIKALEAQGVKVQILSISLTDEYLIKQSIHEIRQTMGPIGGVIHCAGLLDLEESAFVRKSTNRIQQVLEPKLMGLDVLYESFKNEPLQFFISFSSVSAIIPSLAVGISDYAMANAYMDYVAEAKKGESPIISIQWPSWKETGIGEVDNKTYKETGLVSITDEEGLQFLDYILSKKIGPVIMPAVVNLNLWKPQQLMKRKKNISTEEIHDTVAFTNSVKSQPATNEGSIGDMVNLTQIWLTSLFAKELKLDPIKISLEIPTYEYGMDSIMQSQLLRKINQELQEELEPSLLLEYPTIELMAAWLVKNYAFSLSRFLRTSTLRQQKVGMKAQEIQNSLPPSVEISSIKHKKRPPKQGIQQVMKQKNKSSDIAVVGMSCRLPGANSLDDYWNMLAKGESAIRPVPQDRWGYSTEFYAGLLDDITHYDPSFFHISEEDAKAMDPQALLVLEESLKLWYQAGYSHQEVKGRSVGVYLGARSQHQPKESILYQTRNPILAVGQNYLAANISQFFDLRGPSVVIDTACSSALVGMNMAIQSLHSGEIESAIVGGVSLLNTDEYHRIFQQRNILSQEPYFHIFDRRANGIVLGEGVGMVLLKTVEQALQDGDQIYAVIKGIAVNNNGRTAGPATPNLEAQKAVLKDALNKSNLKPEEIRYIETNGSGTEVTDMLELKTIQDVYRPSNLAPLALGSMKPNIGHPLCTEGIAGFIKIVLMLQHGQIVPFLSGEETMKHFDLSSTSFEFDRKLTQWDEETGVAAINCFADGGTNVHVILEKWKEQDARQITRKAMSMPSLQRYNIHEGNEVARTSAFENIWKKKFN
ncbi:SDR family NAD(P)-dependent oxidoreductase [Priestia megaterium]|uniref:SDR family NAD(P)-dependent oxidoreductase n=1 Tax=Priestia megaterium TaxID=1404 RepID=UPI0012D8BE06|nr:SDR family NAD(P)-dependent oxidoreductase [Priestia megaterium]MUL33891.1 Polyketide synthase PksJ [Priestia megaterium]